MSATKRVEALHRLRMSGKVRESKFSITLTEDGFFKVRIGKLWREYEFAVDAIERIEHLL